MPWSRQVTIKLWMMPACFAPSSVQQKSQALRLSKGFPNRNYPRFVIMEGWRGGITQSRFLHVSAGSRLH